MKGPKTYKWVVVRYHDNLVNALGLEGILLLEEGRDVLLGAGRGKGAGDGDQDDLLVLEFCAKGGSVSLDGLGEGAIWAWGSNRVPLLASYLMGMPQLLRPALSGE
jgi:hypothetical protein